MVYVDDAHGEGVLGERRQRDSFSFQLSRDKVHVEMGTFSKAFGVVGGHVSGSKDLVNFAYNKSRTWLLSGSHPPAVVAACIAAIDVLESEPQHVEKLWENTEILQEINEGISGLTLETVRRQSLRSWWETSDSCEEIEFKAIRGRSICLTNCLPDGCA